MMLCIWVLFKMLMAAKKGGLVSKYSVQIPLLSWTLSFSMPPYHTITFALETMWKCYNISCKKQLLIYTMINFNAFCNFRYMELVCNLSTWHNIITIGNKNISWCTNFLSYINHCTYCSNCYKISISIFKSSWKIYYLVNLLVDFISEIAVLWTLFGANTQHRFQRVYQWNSVDLLAIVFKTFFAQSGRTCYKWGKVWWPGYSCQLPVNRGANNLPNINQELYFRWCKMKNNLLDAFQTLEVCV